MQGLDELSLNWFGQMQFNIEYYLAWVSVAKLWEQRSAASLA